MGFSIEPMDILAQLLKQKKGNESRSIPESSKRTDPYSSYRFRIEIDGLISGGFTEVSGFEISTDVESVREGGLNFYEHKLVKGSKYSDITLKRGLSDKEAIWQWYFDIVNGVVKRKNISILLLDETLKNTVKRWDFYQAYPVKWVGPALNSSTNAVSTETVVITHHGLIKA